MSENQRETLSEVFCQVLEQVAFAFGELVPKSDLPPINHADYLLCRIGFEGPFSGEIEIATPSEYCRDLAANTLGVEPEEATSEMAADALKEIANVTCGQWLTAIAGEQPIFDLTVPEIEYMDQAEWEQFRDSQSSIALIVDEFPALISMSMEGEIPGD
ncbi:MAG: chemotaxis protein CheX [Candidatus Coatesbacteria bacterium]|nr:chemotaxis protein CheX [Candidatus Coatesbacteria bacterium]